jgi:tRNA (cytidine/uridine-2'-O-)-methyltransferase
MRLALFQPDIPQNLGAAVRLAACLGVPLDVIEPCGFPVSDRAIRRAALDYGPIAEVKRHASWANFRTELAPKDQRLVLFTTKAAEPFQNFKFLPTDILLFGRESAGVPPEVHEAADARLAVPMAPAARSLNVVNAAAMALGVALAQLDAFPANGFPSTGPRG